MTKDTEPCRAWAVGRPPIYAEAGALPSTTIEDKLKATRFPQPAGSLWNGEEVEVLAEQGDWVVVRTLAGQTGRVLSASLSETPFLPIPGHVGWASALLGGVGWLIAYLRGRDDGRAWAQTSPLDEPPLTRGEFLLGFTAWLVLGIALFWTLILPVIASVKIGNLMYEAGFTATFGKRATEALPRGAGDRAV